MKLNFLKKRFGTLKFIFPSYVDEWIAPFIDIIKKETPRVNLRFSVTVRLAEPIYFHMEARRQASPNSNS